MDGPSRDRPSQNQAARVRPVLRVLLDNLTRIQGLQDLIDPDHPKGFRLHFPPGMVGEAAVGQALTDLPVLHRPSRSKRYVVLESRTIQGVSISMSERPPCLYRRLPPGPGGWVCTRPRIMATP